MSWYKMVRIRSPTQPTRDLKDMCSFYAWLTNSGNTDYDTHAS